MEVEYVEDEQFIGTVQSMIQPSQLGEDNVHGDHFGVLQ